MRLIVAWGYKWVTSGPSFSGLSCLAYMLLVDMVCLTHKIFDNISSIIRLPD